MEELLKFFKDNGVALQITMDTNHNPTVHAIPQGKSLSNLEKTEGKTVVEALENMKKKLFEDRVEFQMGETVVVFDCEGKEVGEGVIVSKNEFREPSMMYAVDVGSWHDDYLFVGESQLELKPKNEQ